MTGPVMYPDRRLSILGQASKKRLKYIYSLGYPIGLGRSAALPVQSGRYG